MKKILASLGFIAAFVGYAFYQNSASASSSPVAAASSAASGTDPNSNSFSGSTVTSQPVATAETQPAPTTQAPTQTTKSTPTPTPAPTPKKTGQYTDGSYTGASVNAYYGYVQVRATVSGGRISNVQFLQYPNDRSTSREINSQAMPYLTQEAISAQSANVDIVSGATDTSNAFRQSLASALAQAA